MIALIKHEDLIISAILCCCARVIETWVFDESATGRRKGLTPVVDLLEIQSWSTPISIVTLVPAAHSICKRTVLGFNCVCV
jgi:hypothetical protein